MIKKCPVCKKEPTKPLDKHFDDHIEASYHKEVEAFHETQRLVQLKKKLCKVE